MVGKRFFPDAEIAASSDGQYGVSIVVAQDGFTATPIRTS